MTIKKVKKFIEEHKKEIVIAGCAISCVALGTVAVVANSRTHAIAKFKEANKDFMDLMDQMDKAMIGATVYTRGTAEEFEKMAGKTIISADNGNKLLDVTGVMFFGNEVEP